jgi:transposase
MKQHETWPDWREWRRRHAWSLKQQSWKQKDIAGALGVTPGAVSQWCTRARTGGAEALRRRRASGRPPKLTPQQVRHLPKLLAPGAEAYGFRGQVWTTKRVSHLIGLHFGVQYHPAHVSRLLRAVSWSVQQPIQRATQRNEAAIKAWREERWPALKKKAVEEKRTIVWIDQSGFYLLPMAVRTWAPRGQTPILCVKLTRDHLSAISGITPDGRLFMQIQDRSYRSEDVVRFLRLLLRKIKGKLLVIWDGAPIHRGQAIKAFLARRAAKRLHLEQLPGYAPELNPDEGIWNLLKRVELKNVCCRDLAHLATLLRQAKERLRHKRSLIQACITQCGYQLEPTQAHGGAIVSGSR